MNHWLGLELRHLAALEAIDAERSFRGAADRLGYVQSAVSQQVKALERLVGARLVERSRGHAGAELTESGRLMLKHGTCIVTQVSTARAELNALSTPTSGVLRVGVFPRIATSLMPRVLTRLSALQPGLHVIASEAPSEATLFDEVSRGVLDVAFAELPLEPGPFQSIELAADPCVLIVARNSELARREATPTLSDLAALPLAFPRSRMADDVEQQLRTAGLAPERSMKLESSRAVQAMVSAGVAAAILPLLAVDRTLPGVEIVDLDDLFPARRIALFWCEERLTGQTVASFAETVKNVCREINGQAPDSRPMSASPGRAVVLRPPAMSTEPTRGKSPSLAFDSDAA